MVLLSLVITALLIIGAGALIVHRVSRWERAFLADG